MGTQYVAAVDVGTTTIRCHILNSRAETVATAAEQVELLYPRPGYMEINPEDLYEKTVNVIKNAILGAGLTPPQVTCMGISTQRCSFVTWDRKTGKAFHNFITWKDLRADKLVKQWNRSLVMKSIRCGCYCLYVVSRSKRFLAGSVLKLMNSQTTLRLVWAMKNIPSLKKAIEEKSAMYGTVDTWLLYKLSENKLHVTDVSNASANGFYDPFTKRWAGWALSLFNIPAEMLPKVVDTGGDFGCTSESIFGARIPIRCSMADQSASLFGSYCFEAGDIKVTLGTGSFMNVNSGSSPHASVTGIYPLIAWKFGDELVYSIEGASNDTGSLIEWALSIGLISSPQESSTLAQKVSDTDGVYFIPAFSGIGPPVNDHNAAAGFLGLKPTATKAHLIRSILESIVFKTVQIYKVFVDETHFNFQTIRVDGGVSKNDFICQLLSDITSLTVLRSSDSEVSVLGAGFLAGLSAGIWKSKEELKMFKKPEVEFKPNGTVGKEYTAVMDDWRRAVERFGKWYAFED